MLNLTVEPALKEILREITPGFEDNLRNDFTNNSQRQSYQANFANSTLQNGLFTIDGNNTIYLSNLYVSEAAPCILDKFQVDLEMLNISLVASIQRIVINGILRKSPLDPLTLMEPSENITFTLENVKYNGNIGIYVVEDSFLIENYDLGVYPTKVSIKVQSGEESSVEIFEDPNRRIENDLIKRISGQLINFFYQKYLFTQLAGAIVEFSVSELFIDEPQGIISLCEERASKANEVVDNLLTNTNKLLAESTKGILEIPPLYFVTYISNKAKAFETQHGELQDVSTIARIGNMSVYESSGIQYIYGYIKLQQLKLKYTFSKSESDGDNYEYIEIVGYRSKILIKLALQKDGDITNISVNKIQALELRDIHLSSNKIENVNERPMLSSYVTGTIEGVVFPILERKIKETLIQTISAP